MVLDDLKEMGFSRDDIGYVVLTHFWISDHGGGGNYAYQQWWQ